ncbi:hypothetical protein MKW94_018300 [Papaver nudicaule]|uniref:DUF7866 domain-containing protein n=1 Tax=Papaver nudicaule TaxID=74823 RepID=A0AA42ATB5_PAPNU|nr:hypothetical protein [Papaver nudicaule]
MSGSGFGRSGVILLLVLFITSLNQGSSFVHGEEAKGSSTTTEMVPLTTDELLHSSPGMMDMVVMNMMEGGESEISSSRRKLNSFRICALCTCCGGPKRVCLPSPCCYAINCNIPNRPFGFCAFTPKTCNCLGCHL